MADIRLVILVVTYLLIAFQRVPFLRLNRPAAALLGAVAMVTIGGLPLREAYAAIDLDVMVFLIGVLLITGYLEAGGFFQWAARRVVARAHSPRTLLAMVVATSGLLSAFFVNDTVCLVLTPLVLAAVRPLGVRPLPFLLAIALAANVGSAMTPTGNPQNMLIGVSSGIHFARFVGTLALPSLGGLVIVYAVLAVVHRRELSNGFCEVPDQEPVAFDRPLVIRALLVFVGALVCWLAGLSLPLVAIAAAGVLLAIAQRDPGEAFAHVEWPLLVFFGALFVVMRGARDLPLVASLTSVAGSQLHGVLVHDAVITSGAMVALSNLVSNVPAVILWLPVVPHVAAPAFVWLVMAMSSTFAGNLTLLGSMANLIVAERAEARGERLGFVEYLRAGVPVTVLTLAWGIASMLLVWPRG
ncbi:MAG TPA: anion transporter [Gemmatimonadaceae bacterium]|nr:anion transporter [Gemmatimonadaceae bacterium]